MLQNLFQKVIILYLKTINFIKRSKRYIDILDSLQSPAHILICMPNDPDAAEYFQSHLSTFSALFPKATFTLLAKKAQTFAELPSAYRLVQYGPEDITFFSVPSNKLKNELFSSPIDLAIDLNLAFDFLSLFLCWQSRANLRIGFGHPQRDHFYNFVIRLNPNQNWEGAFQTLLTYLSAQGNSIAVTQTA